MDAKHPPFDFLDVRLAKPYFSTVLHPMNSCVHFRVYRCRSFNSASRTYFNRLPYFPNNLLIAEPKAMWFEIENVVPINYSFQLSFYYHPLSKYIDIYCNYIGGFDKI